LDNLAWTLWHLGLPREALAASGRGLARAVELAHPFTLAHALSFRAVLFQFDRRPGEALAAAEEAIAVSEAQGFPHRLALGLCVRGWALAEGGEAEPGALLMAEGLGRLRASGAEILRPHFLICLAEASLRGSEVERALGLLEEAEALGQRTGERFQEAELLRVRGEALWALGDDGLRREGLASLRRGLDVARAQGARLLELRSALALGRRSAELGRPEAGREALARALEGFGEGFSGGDFRAARALLLELEDEPGGREAGASA
jgi:predicted ATPase